MTHSNDCTEAILERMKYEIGGKAQGTVRLIKDRACVPHCLKLETVQGCPDCGWHNCYRDIAGGGLMLSQSGFSKP